MSGEPALVTLFNVMLCKQRVRTLTFAGWAVLSCALPESSPPPSADAGAGGPANGGTGNTPTGGTSGTSAGGSSTGGTPTGGSSTGGSTGGSSTGGSTGGSSTGGSTGGSTAGMPTGGAMSGAGGSASGMGGKGGASGTGGSASGMGGKGGASGTGGSASGMGGKGGTGGSPPTGPLVHRYAFMGTDSNAMDSIGTAHGTIMGGVQGSGVVTLTGGSSEEYVQLPSNLLTGLTNATFEVWASWTGATANWQRIFDFGTSDAGSGVQGGSNTSAAYFFLTPRAQATSASAGCTTTVASMPRVAITGAGPSMEACVFGTAAMPTGLTHLAVVIDGTTMTLYIAGTSVGTPVTLSAGLASVSGYDNNWLGRSQFNADGEYAGTISEFRIYNTARTSSQISSSATAGPDSPPTQ